jgi:large subunit ribosomal protein L29
MMKQSEVKELSVEELKEKMAQFKKQHADLKIAHSVTPLENPLQIRKARRTVAQLATELTKRDNQ